MSTGNPTIFFADNTFLSDPTMAAPWHAPHRKPQTRTPTPPPSPILPTLLPILDSRLLTVYAHLHDLAEAANLATRLRTTKTSSYQIPSNSYPIARSWTLLTEQGRIHQDNMVSSLYRIINLNVNTSTPPSPSPFASPAPEVLRLGLLAFASSLFMQWRGSRQRYAYVTESLLSALLDMQRAAYYGLPLEVVLWLYVLGSVTVFNERERDVVFGVIPGLLEGLGLWNWGDTRRVLKGILWIDAMHDVVAEEVLVPRLFPSRGRGEGERGKNDG